MLEAYAPIDEAPEDLPRTLRREREARERERRAAEPEMETDLADARPYRPGSAVSRSDEAPAATVTAIEMPFVKLMAFFVKAVLAAVPALILLGFLLWLSGEILMRYFPWLVKVQILIRVPQ